MRLAVLVVVAMACGHPPADTPVARPGAPRLAPPMPIDFGRPGAAYLAGIALRLQPNWSQFLDDCRLRLPATHALNTMTLVATEELVIDRAGTLVDATLSRSSGNADFDRAAREVIRDSPKYGAPPVELLSDDDRMHVRWLFARDRRQAGPATSEIVRVELPIVGVIDRMIAEGDLARAARRIAHAPESSERIAATRSVMIAALAEAMRGDRAARRAALDAIAAAKVHELVAEVRKSLDDPTDTDIALAAVETVGVLGDHLAVDSLLAALEHELVAGTHARPELARGELHALDALGAREQASRLVARQLAADTPSPVAIEAYELAPVPEADATLTRLLGRGDARTRAAVCFALSAMAADRAVPLLKRGLDDHDAMVRARCVDSTRAIWRAALKMARPLVARVRDLQRDRDREVRAAATFAVAFLDPAHLVNAATDTSAEVRAAYVAALSIAEELGAAFNARLGPLTYDPDVDVRVAAWSSFAGRLDPASVARAVADPAPQVRVLGIRDDDDEPALEQLAAGDDAPEVRTAALVRLAHVRGRARATAGLLERLATASPHSADRARVALAWLLAP